MIFADVIVDISVKSLDRPFQYIVPEEMAEDAVVGARVRIPFGRADRTVQGYIIGLAREAKFAVDRTKSILEIEKQGVVVESHLLSLAYWMKENYGSTMNDAIRAVLPVRKEIRQKVRHMVYPRVGREELAYSLSECERKHYHARARAIRALLGQDDLEKGVDHAVLLKDHKVTLSVLRGLEEQGLIEVADSRRYRDPIHLDRQPEEVPELNGEQRGIVDAIVGEYRRGLRGTYLIHGVTGSGKTEVYMNIITQVIADGKQVIVLIPEIALTFQTVGRFYSRFGSRVSVMHSRLSYGERFDQFERARQGGIDIMIGPRSALFTPFERLGLIIVDEEHETSYQSETPPKYHAREVAVKWAQMRDASVILGSATPSMEAYYRARQGRYKLFTLKHRAGGAVLPRVWVTDLREEFQRGNSSVFGRDLEEMMRERLEKKEQTILFLNRRGYAGSVSCRKCGEAVRCPHCSVSLTAHLYRGRPVRLVCHYCGFLREMPSACPNCGSVYMGTFGIGTQKVEEIVRERFPDARVLRMDADTTKGREGHEKILQAFGEGSADILIGTQMIVKGHDFPNVTLVGILAADLSLNAGNFRAAERTYQLLAQAAGRAGRGSKPGDVVLQTYQPDHYSITCTAAQDYVGFYERELAQRQMLHYPPVSNILGVLVFSQDQGQGRDLSYELAQKMRQFGKAVILGPAPAPLAKAKDVYRHMVYAKCPDYRVLRQIKDGLEAYMRGQETYRNCRLQFEFNLL